MIRLLQVSLICIASILSAQAQDYARNFETAEHKSYTLLTVHNTNLNPARSYQYALVPKNAALPELEKGIKVIRTPVERVVVMETVQLGYMDALGELDHIVGAGSADYINNLTVVERIEDGTIKRVQSGQNIDAEALLLLQPDLILTSVTGNPSFDLPEKLTRTGLPIVFTTSFMERHPLGRAEWVEFIGAFFDANEKSNQLFTQIAGRYNELTKLSTSAQQRPTVFCSAPYSGSWHMPSGDSYMARFIQDAGGNYLWADHTSGGNIPLDTERVFLRAANADVWLNPSHYRTLNALFGADKRFNKFKAARTGRVYNNSKQTTEIGGNPIWEKGIVQPDDVLADLIHILHSDLLPEHEFVFYEQLR
ncbi:MAG: ABC transporter substrate-binding protein [Coraliomargarita sp.]